MLLKRKRPSRVGLGHVVQFLLLVLVFLSPGILWGDLFVSHWVHTGTHPEYENGRGIAIQCVYCHPPHGRPPESPYDRCVDCHSPDGVYDGIRSVPVTGSVGARDNWWGIGRDPDQDQSAIYDEQGDLRPGKEKWCAGCHDDGGCFTINQDVRREGQTTVLTAPNVCGLTITEGDCSSDLSIAASNVANAGQLIDNDSGTGTNPGYVLFDLGRPCRLTHVRILADSGSDPGNPVTSKWRLYAGDSPAGAAEDGWGTRILFGQSRISADPCWEIGTLSGVQWYATQLDRFIDARYIKLTKVSPWPLPGQVLREFKCEANLVFGYYESGHKMPCTKCHDTQKKHIDREHRTYLAHEYSSTDPSNYENGYRLRHVQVEGIDIRPLKVPRLGNVSDYRTNNDFAFCFSCHDRNKIFGLPPNSGTCEQQCFSCHEWSKRLGGETNFSDPTRLERSPALDPNLHALHAADNYRGQYAFLSWDSDWDGTPDSRLSCPDCHNVHGSPSPAKIRHGELISTPGTFDKVPALNFHYLDAFGNPILELMTSTAGQTQFYGPGRGSIARNGVCVMCHHDYVLYERTPQEIPAPLAPESLTFCRGLNIFSPSMELPGYDSHRLLKDLGSGYASSIQWQDPDSGRIQSTYWFWGMPSGNKFAIECGGVYYVHMLQDRTITVEGTYSFFPGFLHTLSTGTENDPANKTRLKAGIAADDTLDDQHKHLILQYIDDYYSGIHPNEQEAILVRDNLNRDTSGDYTWYGGEHLHNPAGGCVEFKTAVAPNYTAMSREVNVSDVLVQADYSILNSYSVYGCMCLFARVTPRTNPGSQDAYLAILGHNGGHTEWNGIWKSVDGEWTKIASVDAGLPLPPLNTWHTIGLSVIDETITLYLDGKVYASVIDGSIKGSGEVSVQPAYADVLIDNLLISTCSFAEMMEANAPGWTADGLWHLTGRNRSSGSYSFWYGKEDTGTYDTGSTNSGSLLSPNIDLRNTGSVLLNFQTRWAHESYASGDYDSMDVEIYFRGKWHRLWHRDCNEGPASADWHKEMIDLTPYVGEIVNVRFMFNTMDGAYNRYEGWFVDDIRIEPSTGGIACWHLDPGSGPDRSDLGLYGNHYQFQGTAAEWVTDCKVGEYGFELKKSGYLNCGRKAVLSEPLDQITLMGWFKPYSTGNGGYNCLIAKDSYHGYQLKTSSGRKAYTSLWINGARKDLLGATTFSLNEWHHFAATYDGSVIKVYLDGKPDGSLAVTGKIDETRAYDLLIGAAYATTTSYMADGVIDGAAIFNRALTDSEIKAAYEAGK